MNLEIQRLFDQIDRVPKVPEVVRLLLEQVNDPTINFRQIAENVEKEQVISVKVLRLVNSAVYGLSRKIGSIQQALVIIGMDELKKLVIVSGMVSSIDEIPGISLDDFWLDNFRTATYAEWLANHTKLPDSQMIFTAGLISSLGRILIHLDDLTTARAINKKVREGHTRPKSEREELGFTSQEICAELCKLWQFSDELTDTVAKSGEPLHFDEISLAACAVFVARYISEANYIDKDKQVILDEFPRKAWLKLGLAEEDIAEKMAEMLALETGLEGLLD